MDSQLIALYHRHVAAAFERQMRLLAFLEQEAPGENWRYTISTAVLSLGDALRFEALDLGSHADPDNSWLWSWCNPHLKLTPANRQLGEAIRKLGQDKGIAAFTATRQVSCDDLFGPDVSAVAADAMAAIAAGELGFDAYYLIPFEHGRSPVLIRDERLRQTVEYRSIRIATTFPRLLSAFPVLDHRTAFLGYLKSYGLTLAGTGQTVAAVFPDGKELLEAQFDAANRLIDVRSKVNSEQ